MGFFNKNNQPRQPWKTEDFVLVVLFALIIIQVFGMIFGTAIGIDIKLGPAFILFAVAAAVWFAVGLARKQWQGFPVDRSDLVVMLILAVVVVAFVILFPKYLPEVFQEGSRGLASMIGLP